MQTVTQTSLKYIKVEKTPSWALVTLNRPEVKNAFNPEMIAEITHTFKTLSQDSSVSAVVIKGEGSVFCAGADLNWMKEMIQYTEQQNKHDSEQLWSMFEAIRTCAKPVISVVHGSAFGGALGIIAASDYVFAEGQTQFCFSEVRLGLAPAVISSFVLKKISPSVAAPLMVFGKVFKTSQALQIGLVTEEFSGNFDFSLIQAMLAANGPQAMIETKKMLLELSYDMDWMRKQDFTTSLIARLRVGAEAQSRIGQFLNKSAQTK